MPVLASHTDALVSTPAPHPHITIRRTISNLPQLAYLSLGRWHGLDVEHGAQQVLDHLVLVLLASRLDLLDVGLGLLVRLLLGLLVSLGVLESFACTVSYASPMCIHLYRGTTTLCLPWGCVRTSASNFLYSSSLDALYSSISFLASSRASLTRFVLYSRAVHQQVSVSSARRCGCSRMGCSWGYRTLLDDLGGVFLGLWLMSAKYASGDTDNCRHTSRRV